MDKNTYTGLFLILVILTASWFLFKPSESEIKQAAVKAKADSLAKVQAASKPGTQVLPVAADTAKAVRGEMLELTNKELKAIISTRGAEIKGVQLLTQKKFDGTPLYLLDSSNKMNLQFVMNGRLFNTAGMDFKPEKVGNGISFTAALDSSNKVAFIYSLTDKLNKVGFNIKLTGPAVAGISNLKLVWQADLKQQEKSLENEQRSSSTYYKYKDGDVSHLSLAKSENETLQDGQIDWISFKQHFFSAVLLNNNGVKNATVGVEHVETGNIVKKYNTTLELIPASNTGGNYSFDYYFGTNKYSALAAQGHSLQKQVELGYWPLKYINRFVVLPLFNFLESLNWNYGLIILTLTLLIKLALSPLTYKSYESMAKMRVLKPEMDEIKEKVGNDNPTLLQQEYMKLYKKAGVNPLGGCLPMLLQLPFVMAFLFFFPNLFELRGEHFLWMKDLSTYDEFFKFGVKLPFLGDHLSLMCLLMTVSQLLLAYYNNLTQPATGANAQMKYIGYIMPVLFLGFLNNYPSGLNYYYFLANITTFIMQFVIRQMINDKKIHALIEQNKTRPQVEKKKSGFQKRMEDYMRQQQLNK